MSSMMEEDSTPAHEGKADSGVAMEDHQPHPPPSSSSPRSARASPPLPLLPSGVNHLPPHSTPSSPSSSLDQRVNSFRAACLDCLIGHQTHHLIPHSSKVIIFDSKLKVQHAFDGLVTHDINCFPELDTRLLTDSGLLFLEQIEARMDSGETVLFACYDRASKALVYRPGDLVFDTRPPADLVCFAAQDKGGRWAADRGGAHAALRVTPTHAMYAQLGTEDEDGVVHYEATRPRLPSGKRGHPITLPPAKRTARSLLSSCRCPASTERCQHRAQHLQMLACAEAGVAPTAAALNEARAERRTGEDSSRGQRKPWTAEEQQAAGVAAAERRKARRWAEVEATLPVAAALGLQSAERWAPFLEVFGFWLGDGCVHCNASGEVEAIRFGQGKRSDHAWLRSQLRACGLPEEQLGDCAASNGVDITNPRWVRWFNAEFGVQSTTFRACDPPGKLTHRSVPTPSKPAPTTRRVSASARCRHSWEAEDEDVEEDVVDRPSADWTKSSSQHRPAAEEERSISRDVSGDSRDAIAEPPLSDDESEGSADPSKSIRLPRWVLLRLTADELRLLVRGLWRAAGSWKQQKKVMWTSDALLRDQLIQLLLHCGCSAYTQLLYKADTLRGYQLRDQASHTTAYHTVHQYAHLPLAQRRQCVPIRARADCWAVVWTDVSDDPEQRFSHPQMSRHRDVSTQRYDAQRDGRLWCVDVYHKDHLIVAQRAHREAGVVTQQSRPILVGNCAPVWDSTRRKYVGLLSVSDFLDILLATAGDADRTAFLSLSSQRLCDWAEFKRRRGTSINRLLCISPESTLHEAVRQLLNYRVHRLCVVQLALADTILRILSNHGILRFLRQSCPQFAHVSIRDLGIGVFENLVTLTPTTPISRAMEMLSQYRVSSIPVVDAANRPVDVYSRSDIRYLAADASWTNLDLTIEAALAPHQHSRTLPLCTRDDSLLTVSGLLVACNKHSLICVHAQTGVVEGVVSLTDIFSFILDSGPPRAESRIAALRADLDRGEDMAGIGGGMLVVEGGAGGGAGGVDAVDRSASGSPAGEEDLDMGDAPDIPPEEDFTS